MHKLLPSPSFKKNIQLPVMKTMSIILYLWFLLYYIYIAYHQKHENNVHNLVPLVFILNYTLRIVKNNFIVSLT